MHFENAAEAAYPKGWEGYQACASYDRRNWLRTDFLRKRRTDRQSYAAVQQRVLRLFRTLFRRAAPQPPRRRTRQRLCRIDDLGSTVRYRDINLLTIGNQVESDMKIWITARQHPGETMAEWFVEGLLGRLLDSQDPTARTLLDRATFYIVPNMNPDGSALGNLRTNAAGANLNREWENPTLEKSPEVFFVRGKMLETGVDLFWTSTAMKVCPLSLLQERKVCRTTIRAFPRWKRSSKPPF